MKNVLLTYSKTEICLWAYFPGPSLKLNKTISYKITINPYNKKLVHATHTNFGKEKCFIITLNPLLDTK